MPNDILTVTGQLFNPQNGELMAEGQVRIEVHRPATASDSPFYIVSMNINGYKPDIDRQYHTLKLPNQISGKVFISIDGLPSRHAMTVRAFLQDPVWNELDWFDSL